MTYYIFSIGGTGARCLESFIYLCAMGLGPSHLFPILVDPDIGNGNLNRTIELINCYNQIRCQIENPVEGSLFYTKIIFDVTEDKKDITKKIPNLINPNDRLTTGMNTLAHFIEYNTQLSKDDKKFLADLLFSSDELNMDMSYGYRGVPSIGSVLMTCIQEHPFWNVLIDSLRNNTGSKVFIFSSVFGGTGASGYPVISQLIKSDYKEAEVGGALILPYFKLRDPRNLLQDEKYRELKNEKVLPNFNSFLINTRAACEYYRNNFSENDANYIIGDDVDISKLYEDYQIGSAKQKNDAHAIELMAAYAALDFWYKQKGKHKAFYRLVAKNPTESNKINSIQVDDLPHDKKIKPFERFSLVYHYVNDLYDYIDKSKADVLDKIAWIRKLKMRGKDVLNEKNSIRPLYEFCNLYKEWIRQNHKNEAELDLLDDELKLDYLISDNPDKYKKYSITKLDVNLFQCMCRKNKFIDSLISSLSKAGIVEGGY